MNITISKDKCVNSSMSKLETDKLEIDYIFNIRNDVKNIINSSDELKKSEAIADAINLLLGKLSNLEKVKEEQIYAYQNLKSEYENLYINFDDLKREYILVIEQNKFHLNEIFELKSFIDKNQNKIIKFDTVEIEFKNQENLNKKLLEEISTLEKEKNEIIENVNNEFSQKIMKIKEDNNKMDLNLNEYKSIINEQEIQLLKYKKIINTLQNMNKRSMIGVVINDNEFNNINNKRNFINEISYQKNNSCMKNSDSIKNTNNMKITKNSLDFKDRNDIIHSYSKSCDKLRKNEMTNFENFTLRPNSIINIDNKENNFCSPKNVVNSMEKHGEINTPFIGQILHYKYNENLNNNIKNPEKYRNKLENSNLNDNSEDINSRKSFIETVENSHLKKLNLDNKSEKSGISYISSKSKNSFNSTNNKPNLINCSNINENVNNSNIFHQPFNFNFTSGINSTVDSQIFGKQNNHSNNTNNTIQNKNHQIQDQHLNQNQSNFPINNNHINKDKSFNDKQIIEDKTNILDEISKKISESEKNINEYNKIFDNIDKDKSNYAKINELMITIEEETNLLIEYKRQFNIIFKELNNL